MLAWWKDLDRILRGDATRMHGAEAGDDRGPGRGDLPLVLVVLAMVYGVCMGCFALFKGGRPSVLAAGAPPRSRCRPCSC